MKLKDRYLVVAGIIVGRNFPIRNDFKIMAEAKFNGHVLTIDPVSHTDAPQFEEELAWELDKKSLHQHKLQRSCLKIQFFAISSQSPVKEFVGYILLDLRSISTNKSSKYFPILHSKYKSKPEVLCCIYLDDDGQEVVNETSNTGQIIDAKMLQPKFVRDTSGPYYQIGPDKLCKTGFSLSITILQVKNLTHLIPTDIPIPKTGDNSFYLYYNLFDNHIISEKFTDLMTPTFSAERTRLNILSTIDILKVYFKHLNSLPIHVCCNKHSLGIAHIPITSLLDKIDYSLNQPAIFEGCISVTNPNYSTKYGRNYQEDDEPVIKVSVVLQKVDSFGHFEGVDFPGMENNITNVTEGGSATNSTNHDAYVNQRTVTQNNQSNNNTNGFRSRSLSPDNKQNKRHLCYTIELRSIRNLARADHTKRIYTRYVYPLFGSAAPIMTHPPVEIRREQEVMLPQGYCAFEFGAFLNNLERKLIDTPLMVEVFERDKTKDSDTCIGVAMIPLNDTLSNPNSKTKHKGHLCLKFSGICNIIASNYGNQSQNVGELVYNLSLEDFGPIKEHAEVTKRHSEFEQNRDVEEQNRNSREYKAALELEIWKENEEASFLAKLKEKENQTMLSLADEWKRRDKEREILVKKKITEYEELEKALRTTIINLAQRERQLAAGEIELQRLRKDLESEVERRTSDLCDASRRMEQDCQHQNLMLSSHVDHWKAMTQDWQSKYQQLDKEFLQYKSRQSNTPETKLQTEINMIQSDKLKLEEALESALKSKDHYKKQWVRALNEVARLKQKHEKISKDYLKRQEQELDQLKLKYKTMEDSGAGSGGGIQLENIKQELNRLHEEAQSNRGFSNQDSSIHFDASQIDTLNEEDQESVMRLIEQRDVLLRTGLYTSHDPVIQELDKEVRKLMEKSKYRNN